MHVYASTLRLAPSLADGGSAVDRPYGRHQWAVLRRVCRCAAGELFGEGVRHSGSNLPRQTVTVAVVAGMAWSGSRSLIAVGRAAPMTTASSDRRVRARHGRGAWLGHPRPARAEFTRTVRAESRTVGLRWKPCRDLSILLRACSSATRRQRTARTALIAEILGPLAGTVRRGGCPGGGCRCGPSAVANSACCATCPQTGRRRGSPPGCPSRRAPSRPACATSTSSSACTGGPKRSSPPASCTCPHHQPTRADPGNLPHWAVAARPDRALAARPDGTQAHGDGSYSNRRDCRRLRTVRSAFLPCRLSRPERAPS